ncbi:DNA repair protein RecO [Oceanicoccus sp. KOV_DT_Chl]|uniref:DNA repair protein RecO n=1 Tax=Oceanicoccus sp. KOV_DT_Chl TaxID=1904639 RepID=UPI000C7A925F|nr:DNA repair protein RecO [Oceanicoccus sp. KOV_DT_Chl]
MRVDAQPAYILHTRNFRDSSLIVDFLTADFGRISGVVKGVRSSSKTAKQKRAATQPFIPLIISWTGKTDLKTITALECRGASMPLHAERLYSGFYINELLSRLLQSYDVHSEIYTLYEWALKSLQRDEAIDLILRRFEFRLLEEMGYGLDLTVDAESGQQLDPVDHYQLLVGQGLVRVPAGEAQQVPGTVYLGKDLLGIACGQFDEHNRRIAKQLCRQLLKVYLGDKPLKSRELFR